MNTTQRARIMQRCNLVQVELIPELWGNIGGLMPKPEKAIHTYEWLLFKEFVESIEHTSVTHRFKTAVPVYLRQRPAWL
ncbi:MAG: hypothetical protein Q8P42_02815 [Gallionella sp.]|nr:hypothetical protein [Gallionella sp.]